MNWWRVAGIVGALGVALGAFGAHGLKNIVADPTVIDRWWQVGARYHLVHAAALLGVAAHPQGAAGGARDGVAAPRRRRLCSPGR